MVVFSDISYRAEGNNITIKLCIALLTFHLVELDLCNKDFNMCPSQTIEAWLLTRGLDADSMGACI